MEKQTLTKDELAIIWAALSGWAIKLGDEAEKNETLKKLIWKIATMAEEL